VSSSRQVSPRQNSAKADRARVVQVVRMAGAVDSLHMVAEDVGALGTKPRELARIEIAHERQVIELAEVDEFMRIRFQPLRDPAIDAAIALEFPLVIDGVQPWVIDEQLRLMLDRLEIPAAATRHDQHVASRQLFLPPLQHRRHALGRLVCQDDVKNLFHSGENPAADAP